MRTTEQPQTGTTVYFRASAEDTGLTEAEIFRVKARRNGGWLLSLRTIEDKPRTFMRNHEDVTR